MSMGVGVIFNINVLFEVIAKRSVVSAANYAERSSFAKDQILFFLSIEVNPHANEVRIQPILSAVCVSILLRGLPWLMWFS